MLKEIYPDTPLVEVPADHPVWSALGRREFTPTESQGDFLFMASPGLPVGALLRSEAIAGYWEANDTLGAWPQSLRAGREHHRLRHRLASAAARPKSLSRAQQGGEVDPSRLLELAELAHYGDWTWPSKAMVNVSIALPRSDRRRPAHCSLKLSPSVDIGDKADALLPNDNRPVREIGETHFFYLDGRKAFNYDEKTLEQLKYALTTRPPARRRRLRREDFDAPFREFIKKLLPEDKLEKIPITDVFIARNSTTRPSIRSSAAAATPTARRKMR